jgi:transposase
MSAYVGIDVAAKSVEVAIRRKGKCAEPVTYEQSPAGHAALIKKLKAIRPACVVMEATGIYYLDLAYALAQAGLPVSVINPRSFRHFAEIKLQNSKTDPIDSRLLAEYAERMTPRPWTPPSEIRMALRDLGRQLNRLTNARTQAKNRLHALTAKGNTLPLLIEDERAGIAQLDARIERLEQAALELIQRCEELTRHFQHIQAAKGIRARSAIPILGELCVLPENLRASQVTRHAGLDVRLQQSGSSLHRPGRLSKAGNAYLRAALYMPVLSAVQHDPWARAFYQSLLARGKKKLQAHCAVMRKYLTGIWACMKLNQPFDSSQLFSEIHMNSA